MRRPSVCANWALPRCSGADKGVEILKEKGHFTGRYEGDARSP